MTRLVFFGTSSFALPSLEALAKDPSFEIVGVVTQPDRPAGRHGTLTAPPIKLLAQTLHLPIFQFEQVKSEEAFQLLSTLQADVAVIVSFGQIIPQRVLDLYPRSALNVHPSLLPAYRGAIPMTAAIRDGLTETGITVMLMDALMDHGPILAQTTVEVLPIDTTETITERLGKLSAAFLMPTLHSWLDGKIVPQPQPHDQATFVKLLSREDGKLDLSRSAAELERLVRAYTPWPGTFIEYQGKRLKILRAHVAASTDKNSFTISCGNDSLLALDEVQPEGKKPMSGEAFLRGNK